MTGLARAQELRHLATEALRARRFAEARIALAELVKLTPADAAAWRDLGGASRDLGRWPEAVNALRQAVRLDPAAFGVRIALAGCLAGVGRLGEARRIYLQLAREPGCRVDALSRLAMVSAASIDEGALATLAAAAVDESLSGSSRIAAAFAAAAALEFRSRYDEAFDAFDRANRLQHAIFQRNAPGGGPTDIVGAHKAAAEHVAALFARRDPSLDKGPGPASGPDARPGQRPIFIVGAPRSGSSVVEQILAAHPEAQGFGETGLLPSLLERAYPRTPEAPFDPPLWRVAEAYLQGLRERGWDGRRRIVDKTLENYLHIGAILRMFPQATIIETRRDRRDAIVGCWRTHFAAPAPSLYDLHDIAAEVGVCIELMDLWRQVSPAQVLAVRLEALVADPDGEIRRLVTQLCQLPWSPSCLRFWAAETTVRTASAAQVRGPLTPAAVGRWRIYRQRLPDWLVRLPP